MKRTATWITIICLLFGLCGCAGGERYELTGQDVFGLPEQASSYTLRHAGESRLYLNFERGDRCAAYQSALRQLPLNPTSKKGSLDANIYEISTMYVLDIMEGGNVVAIDPVSVYVIVSGDLVLYNDQWYEADTSQLMHQLERDFS